MRVLLVVLEFSPSGGLEIHSRTVAASLCRLGTQVDVWSVLERPGESSLDGVEVTHLNRRALWPGRYQLGVGCARLRRALSVQTREFDLVMVMHPLLAPAVHRATRDAVTPFCVFAYGTDVWGPWDASLLAALTRASLLVSISEFTASRLRERLPDANVTVVPPSVPLPPLDELPSHGDRLVLLTVSRVGRADAYKGHDRVIEALPRIEATLGREVQYRIVGDGSGVPRLRQLAADMGVDDRVTFLGQVDSSRLWKEYQACDVFVMPSRMEDDGWGSFTGEGLGIAYLEAASAARPVVGSLDGGAAEAILHGSTGLAIDPSSVEAIADACAVLLGDRELARRMGTAGRAFVARSFSTQVLDHNLQLVLEGVSEDVRYRRRHRV